MKLNRLIYIKWGKGIRRFKVKDIRDYLKVGKRGRFNIYQRKKKGTKKRVLIKKDSKKRTEAFNRLTEQVEKVKKAKISKTEEGFIRRIKGGKLQGVEKEMQIERKLLKKVVLLPRFDKQRYMKKINPRRKIITNGKVYESFNDLDIRKRDIYINLMNNLVEMKDEKFKSKMYALRKDLLRDGIVIEADVFGVLARNNQRKVYFGTLAIVGVMIEDAGFIESELVGWQGENRLIELAFDKVAKSQGGQKCYWIRNNLVLDTGIVFVTDVRLRVNYA